MELLNISPAPYLPRTMWLAFRAVQATPGLTRVELFDAICPEALLPTTPGLGSHAKRAIDALVKFGLLIEPAGGETQPLALGIPRDVELSEFIRRLRHAVLDGPPDPESSPDDFKRALVWLLKQSPNDSLTFTKAVQEQPGVFVNETRWNPFVFWASSLGFGRESVHEGGGLSSDPSAAVLDAIRNPIGASLATGASMELVSLVQHLGSELPVLAEASEGQGGSLLRSLAFALRSLDAQDKITLERHADAPSLVRFPAGAGATEEAMFSHVTIGDR